MATKPISYLLAPALIALGTLLAAGNWYLQRERAVAWAAVMVLFFVLAVVWGGTTLFRRRSKSEAARHASASIGNAIAFAGLIMVFSLSVKLATALGAIDDHDFGQRATMVIVGAVLVFMGNVMPKTLTPLSVMQCDGARAQAFQRFAGWTWVLTGLTYAIVWLALPVDLAKPVSIALVMSGMLVNVAQIVWLRRTRHKEA